MKRRNLLIKFITLFLTCNLFAQNYDLIINTKGDSIACEIDSIDDNNIYFTFKSNSKWVNTNIPKEDVTFFLYDTINKRAVSFYPGTSMIKKTFAMSYLTKENPFRQQYVIGPTGYGQKKGDTYYGTYLLMYHRIYHSFGNKFAMSIGAGYPTAGLISAHYTFAQKGKSVLALHSAIISIFYGNKYGNLTYGQYTFGNQFSNVSIGAGYLLSSCNGSGLLSPYGNFSSQIRIFKNVYFMQEAYVFQIYDERSLVSLDGLDHRVENHKTNIYVLSAALTFISRRRPWNSLKIGMIMGASPYATPPEGYQYNEENDFGGWGLIIYNRKFKR